MAFGIKLLVWGDWACFTRPEMKVERVSYDVITPSAARGILEAIYWKPQMRWRIDRLHVLNPIRKTHVRRNEIASTIPVKGKTGIQVAMDRGRGNLGLAVESDRQQRASLLLRDVRYGIEAHIEVKGALAEEKAPEAKHLEMFRRRASRGQFFHHPYLGTREFPAHFELLEEIPAPTCEFPDVQDLGLMLNDILYQEDAKGKIIESSAGRRLSANPRFFSAVMRRGVIDVPSIDAEGGTP